MALTVPVGCARLRASTPARVRPTIAVSANLSPPRGDAVDWVAATSNFFEQDSRPIMLYDGVCNLCNGGVRFVRDNDRNRKIRFEALQSEPGKKLLRRSGRAPDDISSVVLVEKESMLSLMLCLAAKKTEEEQNTRELIHSCSMPTEIFSFPPLLHLLSNQTEHYEICKEEKLGFD